MSKQLYSIQWSTQAEKQFKKLRDTKLQNHIIQIIEEEIAKTPLVGKPLSEPFKGVRSYRVGQLRILYKIYNKKLIIVVLRIDHRKNVYRRR